MLIVVTGSMRICSIPKALLTPEAGTELKKKKNSLFYQSYRIQLNKKLLKQMKT